MAYLAGGTPRLRPHTLRDYSAVVRQDNVTDFPLPSLRPRKLYFFKFKNVPDACCGDASFSLALPGTLRVLPMTGPAGKGRRSAQRPLTRV